MISSLPSSQPYGMEYLTVGESTLSKLSIPPAVPDSTPKIGHLLGVPGKLENSHLESSLASSHAPFVEENFIRYRVDGLPVSTLGFDLLQKPALFQVVENE